MPRHRHRSSSPRTRHHAEPLAIVCVHVLHFERPVLYVWRNQDDGGVGLACGRGDHDPTTIDDWAMAHASHYVVGDPAMNVIRTLPRGSAARRERKGAPWLRLPLSPG